MKTEEEMNARDITDDVGRNARIARTWKIKEEQLERVINGMGKERKRRTGENIEEKNRKITQNKNGKMDYLRYNVEKERKLRKNTSNAENDLLERIKNKY